MRCYPLKEEYVSFFKGRENVLNTLLKEDSMQLKVMIERIDICDFSMRCIRYYHSSEYELKHNTIIYTSDLTGKKNYCGLYSNYLSIDNLIGFDSFIERYFKACYVVDENFTSGYWLSFVDRYKKCKNSQF